MTTLVLLWVALFGVFPFADPGHDDLGNPVVWLDLALHFAAAGIVLNREIERRVRKRTDAS